MHVHLHESDIANTSGTATSDIPTGESGGATSERRDGVLWLALVTIRLLYQFHFLKSIFTGEAGRATNRTNAIRKTEYDSQRGQRTLMSETAPQ
jgi:hypothetical protein